MSAFSRAFFIILCILAWARGSSQSKLSLSGYTKDVFSHIRFDGGFNLTDNLIHNRLNADWRLTGTWKIKAALRTRLFIGDQPATPFFVPLLNQGANDYLNLSAYARMTDHTFMHSYLDRLYVEYEKKNWQVRMGRQRINWGIHTTWNPNDLFNAFAFTDFDYEERPGSDALSVKYYTGDLSSLEVVVQAFDRIDEAAMAALWRTNRWNYDFQLLTGKFGQHWVFGGGWAGNLSDWGFKGEFSLFAPLRSSVSFSTSVSMGADYVTESGVIYNASVLYNSRGKTSGTLTELFAFELSALNLYPFRWAILNSIGYPIHPLLNGSVALIYSPASSHPLFINPFFSWSVAENLDIDVIAQIALNKDQMNAYSSPIQAYFLRVKWSY